MKKLLLLISVIIAALIYASCNGVNLHKSSGVKTTIEDTSLSMIEKSHSLIAVPKKKKAVSKMELKNQHISPDKRILDSLKALKNQKKSTFYNSDENSR
jgi:hypothetical protein